MFERHPRAVLLLGVVCLTVKRRLALADEMRLVLEMERDFPGGEYPDVDQLVAKLRVEGSFLDVEEVVTLGFDVAQQRLHTAFRFPGISPAGQRFFPQFFPLQQLRRCGRKLLLLSGKLLFYFLAFLLRLL